jgi:hypothetical protein
VFGLPFHIIRNGRATSRLLAAKTPNIEAARRCDAVQRWRGAMADGLSPNRRREPSAFQGLPSTAGRKSPDSKAASFDTAERTTKSLVPFETKMRLLRDRFAKGVVVKDEVMRTPCGHERPCYAETLAFAMAWSGTAKPCQLITKQLRGDPRRRKARETKMRFFGLRLRSRHFHLDASAHVEHHPGATERRWCRRGVREAALGDLHYPRHFLKLVE